MFHSASLGTTAAGLSGLCDVTSVLRVLLSTTDGFISPLNKMSPFMLISPLEKPVQIV